MTIIINLLMVLLIFLITFLPLLYVSRKLKKERLKKRSPLVLKLLRSPGESLSEKIEEIRENITEKIFNIFYLNICAIFFAAYGYAAPTKTNATFLLFFVFCLIAAFYVWYNLKPLSSLWKKLDNYKLGLDAEKAVGQELNLLMRDGYTIFHDFINNDFNIDHIVVGKSGVYAVETKGKAKPNLGRGTKDATIEYDGNTLIFPDGKKNSDAIKQANRQAQFLTQWLSSAVGEKVLVRPALAFPGWFIKKTTSDNFLFLYGTYHNYLKILKSSPIITDHLVKRICHQLEQKCRNIEPKVYNRQKTDY